MKDKNKISLVIPCFNEEESIPTFYKEVIKVSKKLKEVEFEYIFIDDGSKDKTLDILKKIHKKNKKVKYISFSRNYGKEAAMYAGLKETTGDFISIMDVDMQDPPEKLIEMYTTLKEEEYDCVALYTISHEGYSLIRKFLTNIWYKIVNKILKSKQMPGAREFRLMRRQMVDSLLEMKEYNRYIQGMFDYIGYETKWISYEAPNRQAGESKFNLSKLIKYALEGITSFSTIPLVLSTYTGLLFCFIAFLSIIIIIIKTLIFGDPAQGWPSLACIVLFVSGVQLFFLGMIGTYISKIYLETKKRPIYIIKEKSK